MSLIFTESFAAFERTDNATAEIDALRTAMAANLRRGGYDVNIRTSTTTVQDRTGFVVRADPISPERSALVYSSGNTANANNGAVNSSNGAQIRRVLPSVGAPIIGGFSLYIPQEYVPPVVSVPPVLRVNASPANTTGWGSIGGALGADQALQIFQVSQDLLVRAHSTNQSSKALVPGRLNYLEFRITEKDVRVWLDDVLVLQHATALVPESIAFIFDQHNAAAPATFMYGLPSRWAISNFYVLAEDAVAPNVRLGPTTRVIGVRPSSDVDVDFQRPAGFDSNAQVASQSIVDSPVASLQSTQVGDEDVYATALDTATPNAKLVHGIATKVIAANLDSTAHAVRALIRSASGTERVDNRPRELKIVPGIVSPLARTFWDIACRPTDNKIFMCGAAESLYVTPPNGKPGSPWTAILDVGSAINYRGIAFRQDGTGVLARSDGKIQILSPGSDVPGPLINPGAANNTAVLQGLIVLPDGAFLMTGANGYCMRCAGDPSVPANWTRTFPATTSNLARPVLAVNTGMLIINSTSTAGLLWSSADLGLTWTQRATGGVQAQGDRQQFASDGTNFLYINQLTATSGYMRYSSDAVNWIAPSTVYNSLGGSNGGVLQFLFGHEGMFFIFGPTANAWFTTRNPMEAYRRLNGDGTTMNGACIASNGDIMFASNGGVQLAYTSQEFDYPLAPLSGYKMAYNTSVVNPDTGLAWTPEQATQAQFGLRIVS